MGKINRREFLRNSGLAATTFLIPQLLNCNRQIADRPPNIILLMADDLGYGDVGFNGSNIIKTPHLDIMAKAGVRFNRFYAGGPVCSPTRGTCLTGRHHFRYGIFSASQGYLPEEEITLARICKSVGYTTGHFGKWHLASMSKTGLTMPEYYENRERKYAPPWERDYDVSFTTECNVPTWNPGDTDGYEWNSPLPHRQQLGWGQIPDRYDWESTLPFWYNGKLVKDDLRGSAAKVIMDRAIPFIQNAVQKKQPFFTTIWFLEPHEPVMAGPEFCEMYQEYSEGEQHYYGTITAMDKQIGRLRHELQQLGIAENTQVWFCSDNGPEGMNGNSGVFRGSTAGLRGRKRSLFEGGVLGPALLEWPGHAEPGRVIETPCSTLDYFPTVMELIEYKMPDNRPIDGISLLPIINGNLTKRPRPIPFWFVNSSKERMFGSPTVSLIDNNFKLLTNLSKDGHEDMLFDLVADPRESRNIMTQHPDVAQKMKEELRKWMDSCKNSHAGADYPTPFRPVDPFPELTGTWKDGRI
jgi:arylsulfatase A-like enzyme